MFANKSVKKLILVLIFLCISTIFGFLYYSCKDNKDYKSRTLYSMTNDRYLYLRDSLSEVQNNMLQDSTLSNGYYKTYSKYEFSYFAKILDVGCAYGTFLFYIRHNLPSAELYGIDFVDNFFSKKLGAEKNINFAVANIENEPLPFTEKFDVIILTEVLEHFNYNPIDTLKKLAASLKDDGALYLSTPDSSSAWGVTKKYYQSFNQIPTPDSCAVDGKCTNIDDHVWQYNLKELLFVINMAGLEVERLEYTFSGKESRHFNLLLKKRSKQ